MRRWRKMTWVLVAWSAIILVWAVAGGSSAHDNCTREAYSSACDAGTTIGVALILLIGFVGFVFFSLIWFMTRPKGRDCPVCGTFVKRGATVCSSCRHDFAAAVQTAAPTPG